MTAVKRDDPGASAGSTGPVILFDGVCNLCNGAVRFIIRRDRYGRFRFAPLQSKAAESLLRAAGAGPLPDSMVLIADGRLHTQSGAVLRIARGLGGLWPLAYAFMIVPRPLRDWTYRIVARNRYRWFGRRDSCMMPTPELNARFLR
jgi:predicted DCC family thiol-disulfide oxidoreductase YuxK